MSSACFKHSRCPRSRFPIITFREILPAQRRTLRKQLTWDSPRHRSRWAQLTNLPSSDAHSILPCLCTITSLLLGKVNQRQNWQSANGCSAVTKVCSRRTRKWRLVTRNERLSQASLRRSSPWDTTMRLVFTSRSTSVKPKSGIGKPHKAGTLMLLEESRPFQGQRHYQEKIMKVLL